MDIDDIPEAVLCNVCASIFNENSYERWSRFWQIWQQIHDQSWRHLERHLPLPGQHHRSWQSFADALREYCYICSRLFEFYNLEVCHYKDRFPLRYFLCLQSNDKTSLRGYRCYRLRITAVNFETQEFKIISNSPRSASQGSKIQPKYHIWTGREDIAVAARMWVDECLKNHAACAKPSSRGWKPSRLLDISEDKIKLILRRQAEAQEPYVTLSHCWGKDEFLVLTPHLLPRFVDGVHISDFALTFQETILTVRRLGVRYLWIDCYCILQGDSNDAISDWKYESLRMGKVYANSLLNIGALESDGPSHGLFRYSLSFGFGSSKIHWSPTRRDATILFRITQIRDREAPLSISKTLHSNLLDRGWVVQECAMAPRMLSFANDEVIWQCSQSVASEGFDIIEAGRMGPLEGWKNDMFFGHPFWLFKSPRNDSRGLSLRNINIQWMMTLKTYCRSRLSYPQKDLFTALDGIGAELAKISGSRFGYGMLASTLLEALIYGTEDLQNVHYGSQLATTSFPRAAAKRDKTRPTWHWSSLYPEVYFRGFSPTSWPQSSPMAYVFMSDDCKPLPNASSKDFWPSLLLIGRLVTEPPGNECEIHLDTIEDYQAHEARLYLLLEGTSHRPRFKIDQYYWGLVLEKSRPGAYRRVGVWNIWNEEDLRTTPEILKVRPQLIVLE
ncbi:heterokaryon incompatibility protein-domain-containing protein [Xylaria sp. FL1777]|nr:heterokaryon incompatibility protein-domain-containing protein [Xylaria sp. FL1777]